MKIDTTNDHLILICLASTHCILITYFGSQEYIGDDVTEIQMSVRKAIQGPYVLNPSPIAFRIHTIISLTLSSPQQLLHTLPALYYPSHPHHPYPTLHYPILSYPILSYPTLPYPPSNAFHPHPIPTQSLPLLMTLQDVASSYASVSHAPWLRRKGMKGKRHS